MIGGLTDRLRHRTAAIHQALHRSAFLRGLLAGEAAPDEVVAFLRAIATVQRGLQQVVDGCDDPGVASVWRPENDRAPRFGEDLAPHEGVRPYAGRAALAATELAGALREWSQEAPARLLGALYVLEGSTVGGVQLGVGATRVLGTPVRCLSPHGAGSAEVFGALKLRLDGLDLGPSATAEVELGALHTFDAVHRVAEGLQQEDELLFEVNANAGSHAVTWDPREILAAWDAGVASWAAAPYYEARFSARGRHFTRSDSQWLVTLSRVRDPWPQVQWLASLLSSRGMPSYLLEQHLDTLATALTAAVPARAVYYAALSRCASRLREQRLRAVPDFDAQVAALRAAGEDALDLAPLVISALADVRSGVAPVAGARLDDWIADARVDPTFVAAARHALRPPPAGERRGAGALA